MRTHWGEELSNPLGAIRHLIHQEKKMVHDGIMITTDPKDKGTKAENGANHKYVESPASNAKANAADDKTLSKTASKDDAVVFSPRDWYLNNKNLVSREAITAYKYNNLPGTAAFCLCSCYKK
jgi:hypothetical protein